MSSNIQVILRYK